MKVYTPSKYVKLLSFLAPRSDLLLQLLRIKKFMVGGIFQGSSKQIDLTFLFKIKQGINQNEEIASNPTHSTLPPLSSH